MSDIVVNENACPVGWGPGCDSYTKGHFCEKQAGHKGCHACACGATVAIGAGATP